MKYFEIGWGLWESPLLLLILKMFYLLLWEFKLDMLLSSIFCQDKFEFLLKYNDFENLPKLELDFGESAKFDIFLF